MATARIREARALISETTFDRYPTVTAQSSYTRERLSMAQTGPGADRDIELYDVGFDASWELDFFGRVRRSIEASAADVGAAEANFRDAIVSLLAEVARNYFVLRGTQHRLAVARQNAENQRQTLDLTIALLEGGRGTELDTSRAEAQWQSTLASIPPPGDGHQSSHVPAGRAHRPGTPGPGARAVGPPATPHVADARRGRRSGGRGRP